MPLCYRNFGFVVKGGKIINRALLFLYGHKCFKREISVGGFLPYNEFSECIYAILSSNLCLSSLASE